MFQFIQKFREVYVRSLWFCFIGENNLFVKSNPLIQSILRVSVITQYP